MAGETECLTSAPVGPSTPGSTGGGTLDTRTTSTTGGATTGATGEGTTGGATTGGVTTGGTTGGATTGGTTGAPPAPVIVRTLTVDTFSDPVAFSGNLNSMSPPQTQDDNGSMATCALMSGALQLACAPPPAPNTPCYWYTLLARVQDGVCLDASLYTHVVLDVRAAPEAQVSVELQHHATSCVGEPVRTKVNLRGRVAFDNAWHEVRIPLSDFGGFNKKLARAVVILDLAPNIPILIDNLRLVTIQ
ncbi:MAG TPA: hypothetical protein VFH51_16860 [Myxococcota bacterium]|nr:hypothetical protein [Myxococcota bacterium]